RTNAEISDENGAPTMVVNGDTGTVIGSIEESTKRDLPVIRLDSDVIVMPDADYTRDSLQLAYALTVHLAQGSEYEEVIVVFTGGGERLKSRPLAYTAVSRVKRRLTVFGAHSLVVDYCSHAAGVRNTRLGWRVLDALRARKTGDLLAA
ncbi:MAG TPA: ATP-binding domain-containing protein, partial [Steroidobacteraceae bacterium]